MTEPAAKREPTEKELKQFEKYKDYINTVSTIVESVNNVLHTTNAGVLDDYTNMIVCLEIIRTMVITSATTSKSIINKRANEFESTNLSAEASRISHSTNEMIDATNGNLQALITRFEQAITQLRDI